MITAFHHVAIIVSSEKNLEFYRILGFTETFRQVRKWDTVVLMQGHGIELEIFIDSKHAERGTGINEPYGLRHFALEVDGTLDTEIEKLKNSTTEVFEVGPIMTDWTGIRFLFVKDYDGMSIELREKR